MDIKVDQELIFDQIREIFNLGVGKASKEISDLVCEEVFLEVPRAKVINREDLRNILELREESDITAIFHEFSGDVQGEAVLVFYEKTSIDMMRLILKEDASLEELSELDEEALADISSIVVNGVLTAMISELSIKISSAIPYCNHGPYLRVLDSLLGSDRSKEDQLLFVDIKFSLKKTGIEGKLLFVQEMKGAEKFLNYVEEHLKTSLGS